MQPAFLLWLSLAAVAGGVLGSFLGLGGGIIIVPVYTLGLGLPVHLAVGTSLVAVIANASSAATVYLRSRLTNLRLALVLAAVTAVGALVGGLVGTSLAGTWLLAAFGFTLIAVGILMLVRPDSSRAGEPRPEQGLAADVAERAWDLTGHYFDRASGAPVTYRPRRVGTGVGFSFLAGILSGMLGIGGGVVQVPVMNLLLGMPIKAATATSSHIISLTAMAAAVVYLGRGYVEPVITAVTVLGVFVGARTGARLAQVLPGTVIKRAFSVVLFYMALRMLAEAFGLTLPF